MWSWIVIGVLYVLVIGGYRLLGGIGAAGDAVREWGRASVAGARSPRPSS
jgi:Sec-independent protein translocase protein TatA